MIGSGLEGVVTVIDASDRPFAPGTHFPVTCVVTSKASGQDFKLEAPCAAENASGDQWYSVSGRDSGDIETGGGGGLELAGSNDGCAWRELDQTGLDDHRQG